MPVAGLSCQAKRLAAQLFGELKLEIDLARKAQPPSRSRSPIRSPMSPVVALRRLEILAGENVFL